jgi:hypothetical protein
MMERMGNLLYKPRPERWPQFSLRTFFVLVTILSLFFGWLGAQVKWIRDRNDARKWIADHGVQADIQVEATLPLPWSLRILGEERGGRVIWVDVADAPENRDYVERIKTLFPESQVQSVPGLLTWRRITSSADGLPIDEATLAP